MNPSFSYPKPQHPLAPLLLESLYRDPLKTKAGKPYPLDASAWEKLPELKVAELGDWVFERTRAGLSSPAAPARRLTIPVPEGAVFSHLALSARARNVLHAAGVRDLPDLVDTTVHDVLQMRGGGIIFLLELLVVLEGWSHKGPALPEPPSRPKVVSEPDDEEPVLVAPSDSPAAAAVRRAGGILSTRALLAALGETSVRSGWPGIVAIGAGLVALPEKRYEPVGAFLADYLEAGGPPGLADVVCAIQMTYPNADAELVEEWLRRWARVQYGIVSLR